MVISVSICGVLGRDYFVKFSYNEQYCDSPYFYISNLTKPHMKQEIIDQILCSVDIPDYLDISLAIILDLLENCIKCVEFPKYSEHSCKKMAWI